MCRKAAGVAMLLVSLAAVQAYAANQSQLSQSISDGTKSIDIVDGAGATVPSPSVGFGALTFSFNTQDGTGTLGTASQKIRVSNPTSTATWTASIAGSAPTTDWTAGGNHYDFNDASIYTDGGDSDSYGGQLQVSPAGGAIAGVSGCATTNVSMGGNSAFVEGSTDSITIASGSAGAASYCRWDFTNIGLTQKIPAAQASGSYSVNLVLSVI